MTMEGIQSISLVTLNGTEYLKMLTGWFDKILEYYQDNFGVDHYYYIRDITEYNYAEKISFINYDIGFLVRHFDPAIYRTRDGGANWILDYGSGIQNIVNISNLDNSMVYALKTDENNLISSVVRSINSNIVAINDNYNVTPNSWIEFYAINQTYPLPTNIPIRGGTQHVRVFQNPSSDATIFYRWDDGNFLSENYKYRIGTKIDTALFKTQNISTTKDAISHITTHTSPPLRVIRDTTLPGYPTIIHQIHESLDGGIFYSRSTNDGTNFIKEEIVNQICGDNVIPIRELNNNKNSFLNIKYAGCRPLTLSERERNVSAVWERNNDLSGKTEICVSQRVANVNPYTGYHWERYSFQNYPQTHIFTSFNSPQNYNSYPKIFVAAPALSAPETWSLQYIYVPHLEPGTIGNDLHVTAKYYNDSSDFIIGYNVSDVAVTASNYYFGFFFHFAYIKDRNIVYKKVFINFDLGAFYLTTYPNDDNPNVSSGDGQQSRFAPDISLRNGVPVIAWQGSSLRTRTIIYENGNEESMVSNYFPIFARYKSTNIGEGWSTLIKYDSPPNITQQNANVEGSKNKNAFLINYSIDNRNFKQDVKFQDPNYSNYHCCPNYFLGIDAKLVRGSYIDDFGQNSNPMLLTLQQQSPSLYGVSKQPFSITNIPCNAISDNYSNLEGILKDRNINYYFNLGPIIVKNTVVSPNAGLGSPCDITVQNIVDFSENMISKPFFLSNGDTLILAGTGNYILNPNETFANKKFSVSLFKNSTNEIQQLLFRDTINIEDSIQSEYLRGFIINDIHGGSDSFYIQIIIDSSNISDAAYSYCGVFSPDEVPGDNCTNYKSKVHFENQSYQNISNIPKIFELNQNYPNPFNPSTTIKYALPKNEFVTIKVYDITGREIMRLVNEYKQAGYYSVNFNGSNLASGVYFYRIQAGDFISVKRMLMIK
jgi:hypothetical protein